MNERTQLVGKFAMVIFTFRDEKGEITGYKQTHGRIKRANDSEGIVIYNEDNQQEFSLPPNYEAMQPAQPGEYTESSTGKVFTDPDIFTLWEVIQIGADKGGGTEWKHIKIDYPT